MIILAIFIITSCATTKDYDSKLKTWLNKDETSLVSSWGSPNSTHDSKDGNRILIWNKRKDNLYCNTKMIINSQGKVVSYSFEGNFFWGIFYACDSL